MAGFKDQDILKRHLSAFRNNNYKFKYMNSLTSNLMRAFIDRYKGFHSDSRREELLTKQVIECAQHIKYCDDLFFPVALPNLTTDELLKLLMLYSCLAHPEQVLFEKYIDFSSGNIGSEAFAIRLYIFYAMWFEPLFKPEMSKVNRTKNKIISMLEEIETELFIQMEQRAFLWRIKKEIELKLGNSPINYNLYYFIQGERKGGKDLGEKYFLNLLRMCNAKVKNLFLPYYIEFEYTEKAANKDVYSSSEEKAAELNLCMAKEIKKIDDRNSDLILLRNALDQKFKYFTGAIKNRFINLVEKYTTQKRTPPDGLISLDEIISSKETDGATFIELLEDGSPNAPKTSPIEKHKKLLESEFGKTGVVILEFMYENDLINKSQKEIAKALNCTDRTVREYQRKFKEKEPFLLEIFGSE